MDVILGRGNDDILKGGGGTDLVKGGRGDDRLIFEFAENSDHRWRWDFYDGGRGNDTLALELTSSEWSDASLQAEVFAYLDFLEDGGGRRGFKFETMNLRVKAIEQLEIRVDGALITDPRADPPVVLDAPDATDDLTVETGSGDDSVITGSGNDVIDTGDGDDVIESGGGNDVVRIGNGDDVVRTGPGDDTIIAGAGLGDDIIDGGPGQDTVTYPSATGGVNIDLRQQDRASTETSANGTIGAYLAAHGYAATLPVGIATGAVVLPGDTDDIDVDILIDIEHAEGGASNDTIIGNDARNRLSGMGGDDTLDGRGGDDDLRGGSGADTIDAGAGEDVITAGPGDDTIDGGVGYDTIVLSGNSADSLIQSIGNGFYTVAGPDGTDTFTQVEQLTFNDGTFGLWNFVGHVEIFLGDLDNTYDGAGGRERIFGEDGNDTISGGQDEDGFIGGRGNDVMNGGGINDPNNLDDQNFVWDNARYDMEYDIAVGQGDSPSGVTVNLATGVATDVYGDTDTLIELERIWGTRADDSITGSSEDEGFDPNGGDDFIDGGGGYDSLNYHLTDGYYGGATTGITVTFSATVVGSGTVTDPLGDTDTFANMEVVRGTRYADTFTGGAGNQEFRGYDGADSFDGGDGSDLLNYAASANYGGLGGITADLAAGTIVDAFGNTDTVVNIERIRGTGVDDVIAGNGSDNGFRGHSGNDVLSGAGGSDDLEGGSGDDTLDGGADDDVLRGDGGTDDLTGGTGNDRMSGGFDADMFHFAAGDGADTIEDFEVGADRLVLEGGLTIASLSETDVDSDGTLDTVVAFSSGDQVALLYVSAVGDANDLL